MPNSFLGLDFDFAVEIGHVGAHHVEPHAAAGQFGAARRGGEAGAEEQVQQLAAAHALGIVGGDETPLDAVAFTRSKSTPRPSSSTSM